MINGSIAPFAAAAIGFVGISDVSQLETVCGWPLDTIWLAASTAPAGNAGRAVTIRGKNENSVASRGIPTSATEALSATNTISDLFPMRPMAFTSLADAMPVMRSDTTRGITVIRMALTHNVPNGANASAALMSGTLPTAPMIVPNKMAAMSATRTRVLSFI